MKDLTSDGHYIDARKLGLKEYNKNVSKGQMGYLPFLDGIVKNTQIISEINLGITEIPLKKIIGTKSQLRSISFASNFFPIMNIDTEFKSKWCALCNIHLTEGIKHSIKVYEYLNWFYVIEGNKRVSVLKYFDAYSFHGNITRLIPKYDPNDIDICIYYEFLKFNTKTNIFNIYFSKLDSFNKLLNLLDSYSPSIKEYESKYKYFEIYIYNPFREIYHRLGGNKLSITTGDALLEYLLIYGIPKEINEEKIVPKVKELLQELKIISSTTDIKVQVNPIQENQPNILTTLTTLVMPKKVLKVAFVYARTINTSGWSYAHEIGRQYVQKNFDGQIETSYIENVSEDRKAYNSLKKLAKSGNDVIFTTSPIFMMQTLKCALDFPSIKFFNCSEYNRYLHVVNYFGRTYEPRFLTGIVAGSLTKTNIIGYVATSPAPEVISSINAFALGAKLVNPYAKIKVSWTNAWNSHVKATNATGKLVSAGADIVSNQTISKWHPVTKEFGVYSMLCSIDKDTLEPDKYLAAPVWHWGLFYERILKNILNGTINNVNDIFGNSGKLLNFWWGISSGVLDIFYSDEIPHETKLLVDLIKKLIINNAFHPFTGPIYSNTGELKVEKDEVATHEQILTMDWYVENVETISKFKFFNTK